MSSSLSVGAVVQFLSSLTPSTIFGDSGALTLSLDLTQRLTQGIASGQADRLYRRIGRTLGIGATDAYNLLAAGALSDQLGQAIDLDELKILIVQCTAGAISVQGPGALDLPLFKTAADGWKLSAGQASIFLLGAAGLSLGANASFSITEIGGAGSTYSLICVGSQ